MIWLRYIFWPWIKKNWQWLILFPVGIYILYLQRRPKVVVVDSTAEIREAEERLRRLEAEKQERIAELDSDKRAAVEDLLNKYSVEVQGLTDEQWTATTKLMHDPHALNIYLLDVGNRARGRL